MQLPTEADTVNPPPDTTLVAAIQETSDWRDSFIEFLTTKKLPAYEVEARQVVRRASAYAIINNELYKRSTSGVFPRCVKPKEGKEILHEIHSNDCGHHIGDCNLVGKAFRHGFFWLTTHQDAADIVRRCVGC